MACRVGDRSKHCRAGDGFFCCLQDGYCIDQLAVVSVLCANVAVSIETELAILNRT